MLVKGTIKCTTFFFLVTLDIFLYIFFPIVLMRVHAKCLKVRVEFSILLVIILDFL